MNPSSLQAKVIYILKTILQTTIYERTIACSHPPDRTEEELYILVDHGVTVKDVKMEHPVYGDLTASIQVSNREEVKTIYH